jgi:hypothetical protein
MLHEADAGAPYEEIIEGLQVDVNYRALLRCHLGTEKGHPAAMASVAIRAALHHSTRSPFGTFQTSGNASGQACFRG